VSQTQVREEGHDPLDGGPGERSRVVWPFVLAAALVLLVGSSLVWFGAPALAGETRTRRHALDIAASFILLTASVGLGSMILIQTAKHLFRLRGRFNWVQLQRRFSPEGMQELLRGLAGGREEAPRWPPGLRLPGGGVGRLLDLPVEQLAGQIAAVADDAQTLPDRYRRLLADLTGATDTGDGLIDRFVRARPRLMAADGSDEDRQTEDREAVAEVHQRVQRALDVLQASLSDTWKRAVRATASVLSGVLALLFALLSGAPGGLRTSLMLAGLGFGGFFAWFARDIAAAIERRRR